MKATETYRTLPGASAGGPLLPLFVTVLLGCTNSPSAPPEVNSPLGGMPSTMDTDVSYTMADSAQGPNQDMDVNGKAGAQEEADDSPTEPSTPAGDDQTSDPAIGEDDDSAPSPVPEDEEPQPPANSGSGGPRDGSGQPAGSGQESPPPPRTGACDNVNVSNASAIAGSGVIAAQSTAIAHMPQLRIESAFQAELTVDPQHTGDVTLTVRTDDNILPFVVIEVRDGTLVVGMKDGAYCLSELSVEGTVGPLSELSAADGSKVQIRGLQGQTLAMSAENASEIDATGQAQRWDLRFENASKGSLSLGGATTVDLELVNASAVSLAGTAAETLLVADTASELLATTPSFETRTAQVDVNGISSARLCVSDAVAGNVQALSTLRIACNGKIEVVGTAMRE